MKIILSLVVGAAVIVVVAILTISYNQIDWLSLSKQNYVVEVEHFKLIISIVSTSITFLAVLVALFKEDLRELWNRPIIDIVVPDKSTIEETSEVTDRVGIYEAQRYISRVKIKNNGKVPAINVELYLEKLIFKEKDSNIEDDIGTISTPILWQGTNKESIIIPPGSHKMVNMVEIIAPQKISLPDAPKQTEECKLIIGNTESTHKKGTWLATFGLYAQNHKSVNFQVEIEFKGHWKTRLAEMEKQYTMTIKNNTR